MTENKVDDDKRARFERLAEKRVTELIKRLRLVGNLANRHNYSYDEEHIRQILESIENEVRVLKNRFKEEGKIEDVDFSFVRTKQDK